MVLLKKVICPTKRSPEKYNVDNSIKQTLVCIFEGFYPQGKCHFVDNVDNFTFMKTQTYVLCFT